MRHGNTFILWLAGCYGNNLSFLFFSESRRSPRARGIGQERFKLPAIHGIAQSTRLVFAFQSVKFSLVVLPTLTPATDSISSNAVFGGNRGLIARLGIAQDETSPQDHALRASPGMGEIAHQFCLCWCKCEFFHSVMSIARLVGDL